MILTRKTAIIVLLITISFIYLWNYILHEREWLSVLGTSLFPIIIGFLSFRWNFQAYRSIKGQEKYIWLMISLGLILHITGNIIWFLGAAIRDVYIAPDISYLFWVLAYFVFLSGLIYKLRLKSPIISTNPYLFNTAIFIIVISALFVHYFVRPYIATEQNLFQLIINGLLYPVVDISILFVASLLYSLSRSNHERLVMLCFLCSFYLSIMGDTLTAFMKTNNDYYQLLIEPLWVGSLLLIGYAAYVAKRRKHSIHESEALPTRESSFPYFGIIILIVLAFQSINWHINALNIGLLFLFVMIIGRNLITIRKNRNLMLKYRELAYEDSLTGLSNRSCFKVDLEKAIEKAEIQHTQISILLLDLDRFKMINDTLGHLVGDQLLKETALRLQYALNSHCSIYRLGGDEFVVLLEEASGEKAENVAREIIEVFQHTFTINHQEINITPSVGISSYPESGIDSDALFKAADAAMYLAKGKGRNNYQFYNSELNEVLTRKLLIENELRKAISRNEFELYYQPKFHLQSRRLIGMEALLRWNSKKIGPVSPAEFIPVAEDTGLIVSIGEWVLKNACIQNKKWQQRGYEALCLSVNVSVQQFKHSNIVNSVENVLKETGLNPNYLELEITESIMQNVEESKKVMTGLRGLGLKISLDDFGTGYSSLHILKNLPINTLKIDKSFISDIKVDNDQSMVKGIIDIASNLDLEIVAEGIEQEYQLEVLAAYDCHYGQGYLFSKPVPVSEFENTFLVKAVAN
jgi:diguanylate cyclase (GGDEF)-like protein